MSKYKTLEVLESEGIVYPVGSILELTDEQAVDLLDKMEEAKGMDILAPADNIAAPIIPETTEPIVPAATPIIKTPESGILSEIDGGITSKEDNLGKDLEDGSVKIDSTEWVGNHDVMSEEKKNETI